MTHTNSERVIKFRCWDKNTKSWLSCEDMPVCTSGEENKSKIWQFGDNGWCIFSQFTGLHDKNGKEIYEGDIVEFPPFNKEWCEGEYLPRQRFTADLSKLRLWLKEEMFGYEGELLLDSDKCEVIGNIYENGDLLK